LASQLRGLQPKTGCGFRLLLRCVRYEDAVTKEALGQEGAG
jgi:hypothetical protein